MTNESLQIEQGEETSIEVARIKFVRRSPYVRSILNTLRSRGPQELRCTPESIDAMIAKGLITFMDYQVLPGRSMPAQIYGITPLGRRALELTTNSSFTKERESPIRKRRTKMRDTVERILAETLKTCPEIAEYYEALFAYGMEAYDLFEGDTEEIHASILGRLATILMSDTASLSE